MQTLLKRDGGLADWVAGWTPPLPAMAGWWFIGGEAGVGKTTLVAAFAAAHRREVRVAFDRCDALTTPRALGRFLDAAVALGLDPPSDDGYVQFFGCVHEPLAGSMGIHFVNGALVEDTVVDPALPEALMYEVKPNGRLELLGVEYVVFKEAWDAEHDEPPTLFDVQRRRRAEPLWHPHVLRAPCLGMERTTRPEHTRTGTRRCCAPRPRATPH